MSFAKKVLTSKVELEAELQDISARHGFSPYTHEIVKFDNQYSFLIMDKIYGTILYDEYGDDPKNVPEWIWNQIRFMISKLYYDEGIEYIDITPFNFMITNDEKIFIIDFGDAYYTDNNLEQNWFLQEFLNDTNLWNSDFK